MSGIVKVVVRFFFRKGEEVAIERHRSRIPVDKEAHKGVSDDVIAQCAVINEMRKQPMTIDLNLLF